MEGQTKKGSQSSNFSKSKDETDFWNLLTLTHFEGIWCFITLAKFDESYGHLFSIMNVTDKVWDF